MTRAATCIVEYAPLFFITAGMFFAQWSIERRFGETPIGRWLYVRRWLLVIIYGIGFLLSARVVSHKAVNPIAQRPSPSITRLRLMTEPPSFARVRGPMVTTGAGDLSMQETCPISPAILDISSTEGTCPVLPNTIGGPTMPMTKQDLWGELLWSDDEARGKDKDN